MPTPDTFGGLQASRARGRTSASPSAIRWRRNGGMIERWDGTSWSIQPSPPDVSELLDVSCSGLLACTAVGYASTGNTGPNTPRLPSAGTAPAGTCSPPRTPLGRTAASCRRLVSAETHVHGRRPVERGRLARLSSSAGSGASIRGGYSPRRSPKASRALRSAACPVRTDRCVRRRTRSQHLFVGTPRLTLAERRVGSRWSVMPTPNRRRRRRPFEPRTLGVSCPGLRACHAVGTLVSTGPSPRSPSASTERVGSSSRPEKGGHAAARRRLLSKPVLLHGRRLTRGDFGGPDRRDAGREVDALIGP